MIETPDLIEEEQDLYEHYRIVADKGQGLLRIDKFLMTRIEGASRNKIQNAAHAGNIDHDADQSGPHLQLGTGSGCGEAPHAVGWVLSGSRAAD